MRNLAHNALGTWRRGWLPKRATRATERSSLYHNIPNPTDIITTSFAYSIFAALSSPVYIPFVSIPGISCCNGCPLSRRYRKVAFVTFVDVIHNRCSNVEAEWTLPKRPTCIYWPASWDSEGPVMQQLLRFFSTRMLFHDCQI